MINRSLLLPSIATLIALVLSAPLHAAPSAATLMDPDLQYPALPERSEGFRLLSRRQFQTAMQGFWLGQSLANWTGLITEMDKNTPPFYTDADWGKPDQKSVWGEFVPHATRIDFYFVTGEEPWGADDDTDIEYMYQHLLDQHNTSVLSAEQIRDGWLRHIYSNDDAPLYQKFADSKPEKENFLWVSNENAYELMRKGMVPPATSEPANNPDAMMIDAQLTTEIFGFFAPTRPDIALRMAHLPIRTTANNEAQSIAEFYVVMHSLAASVDKNLSLKDQVFWLADQARSRLPQQSYPAQMFNYVKRSYDNNPDKNDWEKTRDGLYWHFQAASHDGYEYQQPYDAGINFAASLVSLFYGQGDLARTIQIGSLAGWDSDNPAATWGGLIGYLMGKAQIEKTFSRTNLSDRYWIHRTRRNFPDYTPDAAGEDTFSQMAKRAVLIVDRVVVEEMGGFVDLDEDQWWIPLAP